MTSPDFVVLSYLACSHMHMAGCFIDSHECVSLPKAIWSSIFDLLFCFAIMGHKVTKCLVSELKKLSWLPQINIIDDHKPNMNKWKKWKFVHEKRTMYLKIVLVGECFIERRQTIVIDCCTLALAEQTVRFHTWLRILLS